MLHVITTSSLFHSKDILKRQQKLVKTHFSNQLPVEMFPCLWTIFFLPVEHWTPWTMFFPSHSLVLDYGLNLCYHISSVNYWPKSTSYYLGRVSLDFPESLWKGRQIFRTAQQAGYWADPKIWELLESTVHDAGRLIIAFIDLSCCTWQEVEKHTPLTPLCRAYLIPVWSHIRP